MIKKLSHFNLMVLALMLFAFITVQGESTNEVKTDEVCKKNPIFQFTKEFADIFQYELEENKDTNLTEEEKLKQKQQQEVVQELQQILKTYEETKPSTQSDLGFCSQFNGQSSCCTKPFLENFEKIFEKLFLKYSEMRTKFAFLMQRIKPALQKCLGVKSDGELDLKESEMFDRIEKTWKICQGRALRSQIRFFRGNLCGLCAGQDKWSEVYDGEQDKMIVNKKSFDLYMQDISGSVKCLDDARKEFVFWLNKNEDVFSKNKQCEQLEEYVEQIVDSETIYGEKFEKENEYWNCSQPNVFDMGCINGLFIEEDPKYNIVEMEFNIDGESEKNGPDGESEIDGETETNGEYEIIVKEDGEEYEIIVKKDGEEYEIIVKEDGEEYEIIVKEDGEIEIKDEKTKDGESEESELAVDGEEEKEEEQESAKSDEEVKEKEQLDGESSQQQSKRNLRFLSDKKEKETPSQVKEVPKDQVVGEFLVKEVGGVQTYIENIKQETAMKVGGVSQSESLPSIIIEEKPASNETTKKDDKKEKDNKSILKIVMTVIIVLLIGVGIGFFVYSKYQQKLLDRKITYALDDFNQNNQKRNSNNERRSFENLGSPKVSVDSSKSKKNSSKRKSKISSKNEADDSLELSLIPQSEKRNSNKFSNNHKLQDFE